MASLLTPFRRIAALLFLIILRCFLMLALSNIQAFKNRQAANIGADHRRIVFLLALTNDIIILRLFTFVNSFFRFFLILSFLFSFSRLIFGFFVILHKKSTVFIFLYLDGRSKYKLQNTAALHLTRVYYLHLLIDMNAPDKI